jgi:hypothetical protein
VKTFSRHGGYHTTPTAYRSGLEDKVAQQLDNAGIEAAYEKYKLPYIIPATDHYYTPDWVLPNGIIVEAKGLFDADDRKKHLLIKEQYPHLDIRFVFSSPATKIYSGSKTTVADWCEKHGYKYAKKFIPAAWFDEPAKSLDGLILKKGGSNK